MFRYFSSHTAFLGMIGSLAMCFVIGYLYALVAIAILIVLVIGLHMRSFESSWGSISQALIFHQVRKYLLLLDIRKNHIKFWRPQMLLMVSNPRGSCQMIDFVNDLKKSGLYVIGHVETGDLDAEDSDPIQTEFPKWLSLIDHLKVKAFAELTLARSIREGMHHLIRVSGIGGMKPNTICFGFYDKTTPQDTFTNQNPNSSALLSSQSRHPMQFHNSVSESNRQTELYQSFASLRQDGNEKQFTLEEYVHMIRDTLKLNKNVCLCRHFHRLNKETVFASAARKKVFIDVWPVNFFHPESTVHFDNTCLFMLQLACILHMVPGWKRKSVLRVFMCIEREEAYAKEKSMLAFLRLLRIRGEIKIVSLETIVDRVQSSGQGGTLPSGLPTDVYIKEINEMIQSHCSKTAVVFLYLPKPPTDLGLHSSYHQQLEQMTDSLPPTVLVHGLHPVTSTTL